MKTKRKTSGFFIVEILIVLVIIGILVVALIPNLTTYAQRAKFVDVLSAANGVKAAVGGCIVQQGSVSTGCNSGTLGIPASVSSAYGGYANALSVASGIITSTSTASFGASGAATYTYILTPTYVGGAVTWAATGSCAANGLC
jgi:type IV pilus assembly protein PilA